MQGLSQEEISWIKLIKRDPSDLFKAPLHIRSSRHIILAVSKNDGWSALKWTTDKLREDKEIIESALENDGYAI